MYLIIGDCWFFNLGGFFLGGGGRTSQEEKKVLNEIELILNKEEKGQGTVIVQTIEEKN